MGEDELWLRGDRHTQRHTNASIPSTIVGPAVRLVPPSEALSLAVENENAQEFFILYGWSLFYG